MCRSAGIGYGRDKQWRRWRRALAWQTSARDLMIVFFVRA